MFRLLVVPLSIGILAFLFVYFIAPAISSEPDIVSYVAEIALYFSNSYFENMPPIIASYIAYLNLAIVAFTVAILLTVLIQLVVVSGGTFIRLIKWMISHLQRDKDDESEQDLPPIDIDSKYMNQTPGKEILGRGIDSIDRDRRI